MRLSLAEGLHHTITFSGAIAARCPYLAVTERMPSYAAVRATVNLILCFTC